MPEPATGSRLTEARLRFSAMSMSELVEDWDERQLEDERALLFDELDSRGYRTQSLPAPVDDFPSESSEVAAALLSEEAIERGENRSRARVTAGGATCLTISATILLLGVARLFGYGEYSTVEWVGLALALPAFLILGGRIDQGSKWAAMTALFLWGIATYMMILRIDESFETVARESWELASFVVGIFFALLVATVELSRAD